MRKLSDRGRKKSPLLPPGTNMQNLKKADCDSLQEMLLIIRSQDPLSPRLLPYKLVEHSYCSTLHITNTQRHYRLLTGHTTKGINDLGWPRWGWFRKCALEFGVLLSNVADNYALHCVLVRASIALMKHHSQKQLGEKRFILPQPVLYHPEKS